MTPEKPDYKDVDPGLAAIRDKMLEVFAPRAIGRSTALLEQAVDLCDQHPMVFIICAHQDHVRFAKENFRKVAGEEVVGETSSGRLVMRGTQYVFTTFAMEERDAAHRHTGPRLVDHFAIERELLRLLRPKR